METFRLFVYGTLMSGYGNNRLLCDAKLVARVKTKPQYTLYARGIPYLVEGGNTAVEGEVYDVPLSDRPRIDSLEGHPNWYCRKPVELQGDFGDVVGYVLVRDLYPDTPVVPSGNFRDVARAW